LLPPCHAHALSDERHAYAMPRLMLSFRRVIFAADERYADE